MKFKYKIGDILLNRLKMRDEGEEFDYGLKILNAFVVLFFTFGV